MTTALSDRLSKAQRAMELGMAPVDAFVYAGYTHDYAARCVAKALDGDPVFHPIFDLIMRANAMCEMRKLEVIDQATQDDWRAAAWFLERRHRKRWAKDPEQILVQQQAPQAVDVSTLSTEDLKRIIAAGMDAKRTIEATFEPISLEDKAQTQAYLESEELAPFDPEHEK